MIETVTAQTDFAEQRQVMVASQLRPSGVDDPRVVAAMARIPRERFVPAAVRDFAYRDRALAVGGGRSINPPLATALLLVEARLRATDRVLLLGAAGGYAAALLSALVGTVVAVEGDAELAAIARRTLDGIGAVTLVVGDPAAGAPDAAPYDAIVIDGAVEDVPAVLGTQLAPGGRIVAGLVDRGVTRLAAGTATARGVALSAFADMEVAVLPGFARTRGFRF